MAQRLLDVYYIVPSHYDNDGYVHRYWRGVLPSNTANCLKGLTEALAAQGELGPGVKARVTIIDDTVQRPPLARIIRRHRRRPGSVLVGFAGVQSNQFARASDLALELRRGGVPVMIGGFHVSGILAMLDEPSPELQELLDHGVTLVKGEVDGPGVMAGILRDALAGELKPLYDIHESPDLTHAAVPAPDPKYLRRFLLGDMGTMDTSRGCPFNCSFCTIINVQGKKMRCRSAASILKSIRENYAAGVRAYFFTDDNLSRSPVWEAVFDGLRVMRDRGVKIRFMMQVDTQAYRIPRFVEKARQAGCHTVFVGMETVNPRNIEATGKVQNDASSYRRMVEAWHEAGIQVHVGYIIGLPYDSPESVREDIETLREEVQVDEASFFMLTPLPGSRDHADMVNHGVLIDADLNDYDSTHETFRHPNFAPGEWLQAYREAWHAFYSKESVLHILLRAPRHLYWGLFWTSLWYRWSTCFVETHPMSTGLMRLKDRKSRRPCFPREGVWRYGWRRVRDLAWGARVYAQLLREFQEIWFLTRKPDDPRWATLAELRLRWMALRVRLGRSDVGERCGEALSEIRALLLAASERLSELSSSNRPMGTALRARLRVKAREVEAYVAHVRAMEVSAPRWEDVQRAQQFVSDSLVAGYEEAAIRYVATRRRLNAYRAELIDRVRKGEILRINPIRAAKLVVGEVWFAVRFAFSALTQGV